MIPNGPPPSPSPSLASAEASSQVAKQVTTKNVLMIFCSFYDKVKKITTNHRCIIKTPITILYWVLDGSNIGPYSPPPSPSPASANVYCQEAKKLRKNSLLVMFYDFYKKEIRKIIKYAFNNQ